MFTFTPQTNVQKSIWKQTKTIYCRSLPACFVLHMSVVIVFAYVHIIGRCEYQLDIWTLSYHCSRGFHTDESQRLPLLSFYPFKSSCSHTIVFFISFPRLRLLLNTVAPLVTLPKKGGEKETSLSCSFWTISLLREMYGTTGEGDNGRGERGKRYGRGGRERERILSVI